MPDLFRPATPFLFGDETEGDLDRAIEESAKALRRLAELTKQPAKPERGPKSDDPEAPASRRDACLHSRYR